MHVIVWRVHNGRLHRVDVEVVRGGITACVMGGTNENAIEGVAKMFLPDRLRVVRKDHERYVVSLLV